jgi:hypothetical protein
MDLMTLQPRWVVDKDGRHGMGMGFNCPHCVKENAEKIQRLHIWFINPIDGKEIFPLVPVPDEPGEARAIALSHNCRWTRTGELFEAMTIHPSIDASKIGHWHGFVTEGKIT